jgi:hypothetical protein
MEAKGCIDAKVHLSLLGLGLVLAHHNPHTDTLHFVAQELSGVTFQILNCHTLNKAIWRTGLRFLMWLIQDLPGFYECYRDTITMLVPKANFLGMQGPAKTLLELKYLVRASLFHVCCAPLENKPFYFPWCPLRNQVLRCSAWSTNLIRRAWMVGCISTPPREEEDYGRPVQVLRV